MTADEIHDGITEALREGDWASAAALIVILGGIDPVAAADIRDLLALISGDDEAIWDRIDGGAL